MERTEALKRIRDHATEFRAMHVRSLRLFGSVARNEAGAASDVDLLVDFSQPVGLFHFVRLQTRLEEILGQKVDLVTEPALREGVRQQVLREALDAA
jgi:predicted nucleotidyltransferase